MMRGANNLGPVWFRQNPQALDFELQICFCPPLCFCPPISFLLSHKVRFGPILCDHTRLDQNGLNKCCVTVTGILTRCIHTTLKTCFGTSSWYPHPSDPYVRHGSIHLLQQMNVTMNTMIQKNDLVVEKQSNSPKMQSCFTRWFRLEIRARCCRIWTPGPALALTQLLEIGRCWAFCSSSFRGSVRMCEKKLNRYKQRRDKFSRWQSSRYMSIHVDTCQEIWLSRDQSQSDQKSSRQEWCR